MKVNMTKLMHLYKVNITTYAVVGTQMPSYSGFLSRELPIREQTRKLNIVWCRVSEILGLKPYDILMFSILVNICREIGLTPNFVKVLRCWQRILSYLLQRRWFLKDRNSSTSTKCKVPKKIHIPTEQIDIPLTLKLHQVIHHEIILRYMLHLLTVFIDFIHYFIVPQNDHFNAA